MPVDRNTQPTGKLSHGIKATRAACLPLIAVTFGSVTGLRKARAFLLLRDRSVSLAFSFFRSQLTTQTQPSHDFVVMLYVRPFQVIEHTSALRDHLQQAAPRMIVLLMRLEMLGEFVNALT